MLINPGAEMLIKGCSRPGRWLIVRTLRWVGPLLLAVGLILGPSVAQAAPPESAVVVTTDTSVVEVMAAPCSVGRVTVRLTNNGPEAVYGDAFVRAEGLSVSARLISSYLPSGYTWVEQLQITATEQTEPGEHEVLITAGESTARVTVTVAAAAAGGNLARTGNPMASSIYAGRTPCGALDGNKDSDLWSNGVGWSDNTNSVYPDWWQVSFAEPVSVSRVDLYTIDSVALPAAKQGLSDWEVQVPDGADWRTVATVADNTEGMVSSTFDPVSTNAIRIVCIDANGNYSRILELEAFA